MSDLSEDSSVDEEKPMQEDEIQFEPFRVKTRTLIANISSYVATMEINILHNWSCIPPEPQDIFSMLEGAERLSSFLEEKFHTLEDNEAMLLELENIKYTYCRSKILIYIIKNVLQKLGEIDNDFTYERIVISEVNRYLHLIKRFGLKLPMDCSILKFNKKKLMFSDFSLMIESDLGLFSLKQTEKVKGILKKPAGEVCKAKFLLSLRENDSLKSCETRFFPEIMPIEENQNHEREVINIQGNITKRKLRGTSISSSKKLKIGINPGGSSSSGENCFPGTSFAIPTKSDKNLKKKKRSRAKKSEGTTYRSSSKALNNRIVWNNNLDESSLSSETCFPSTSMLLPSKPNCNFPQKKRSYGKKCKETQISRCDVLNDQENNIKRRLRGANSISFSKKINIKTNHDEPSLRSQTNFLPGQSSLTSNILDHNMENKRKPHIEKHKGCTTRLSTKKMNLKNNPDVSSSSSETYFPGTALHIPNKSENNLEMKIIPDAKKRRGRPKKSFNIVTCKSDFVYRKIPNEGNFLNYTENKLSEDHEHNGTEGAESSTPYGLENRSSEKIETKLFADYESITNDEFENNLTKENYAAKYSKNNLPEGSNLTKDFENNLSQDKSITKDCENNLLEQNSITKDCENNLLEQNSITKDCENNLLEQNSITKDCENNLLEQNSITKDCENNLLEQNSITKDCENNLLDQNSITKDCENNLLEPNSITKDCENNLPRENWITKVSKSNLPKDCKNSVTGDSENNLPGDFNNTLTENNKNNLPLDCGHSVTENNLPKDFKNKVIEDSKSNLLEDCINIVTDNDENNLLEGNKNNFTENYEYKLPEVCKTNVPVDYKNNLPGNCKNDETGSCNFVTDSGNKSLGITEGEGTAKLFPANVENKVERKKRTYNKKVKGPSLLYPANVDHVEKKKRPYNRKPKVDGFNKPGTVGNTIKRQKNLQNKNMEESSALLLSLEQEIKNKIPSNILEVPDRNNNEDIPRKIDIVTSNKPDVKKMTNFKTYKKSEVIIPVAEASKDFYKLDIKGLNNEEEQFMNIIENKDSEQIKDGSIQPRNDLFLESKINQNVQSFGHGSEMNSVDLEKVINAGLIKSSGISCNNDVIITKEETFKTEKTNNFHGDQDSTTDTLKRIVKVIDDPSYEGNDLKKRLFTIINQNKGSFLECFHSGNNSEIKENMDVKASSTCYAFDSNSHIETSNNGCSLTNEPSIFSLARDNDDGNNSNTNDDKESDYSKSYEAINLSCINNKVHLNEVTTTSEEMMNTEQFLQSNIDVNYSQNVVPTEISENDLNGVSLSKIKKCQQFKAFKITSGKSLDVDFSDLYWA